MSDLEYDINYDEELLLDCEVYCVLGKKIILASTFFETGLALLLHAEAEAIDKITDRLPEDLCTKIDDLEEYNKATKEIICCLSAIKQEIVTELKIGREIANTTCDPCICAPC
jgi:hypothetical protein